MNILEVAPYFPYEQCFDGMTLPQYHIGGVERHVWELSRRLAESGHKVDVITSGLNSLVTSEVLGSIRIHRLRVNIKVFTVPISFKLVSFLIRYLKKNKVDVLHAHTPVPFYADVAAIACRICKVPFIVTIHNDIVGQGSARAHSLISRIYNSLLGSFQFKTARKIIVTTHGYMLSSKTVRKRFVDNIVIIPNAVDTLRFTSQDKDKAKRQLQFEGKKVVLYVGYLGDYKGLSFLIEAFYLVKEIPNLHLVLVGEGPLRDCLEEEARKLGIFDKITFTGYLKDCELPLYYSAADVFVLPSISRAEGFGIVQLEAMASGTPVIATSILGVNEVAKEAALIVAPRSSKSLAKAILTILCNEDLAKEMAHKGRQIVEEKYSWKIVTHQMLTLLKNIVESRQTQQSICETI